MSSQRSTLYGRRPLVRTTEVMLVAELLSAAIMNRVMVLGRAVDRGPVYDEASSERHFERMLALFGRSLET